MNTLSYKNIKFLLVSIVSSIVSLLITAVFAFYVPQTYEVRDDHVLNAERERIYTREELDKADERAKEVIEQKIHLLKEAERKRSKKESIQKLKRRAIYVSWIPWLIIPFLLTISRFLSGFILLLIPTLLIPTGIFLLVEVGIFSICLLLGSLIAKFLRVDQLHIDVKQE